TVLTILFAALLAAIPALIPATVLAQETRTGAEAFGTWEDDAPGVERHITPADLPPPRHTENEPEAPVCANMAYGVEPPAATMPDVPDGFTVQVFASGLNQPRVIRIAPNGDVFVSETGSGRVLVYPGDSPSESSGSPASGFEVFAEGLDRPFGIAFYPASDPQYVYVGAANQVVRFPYTAGDRMASGPAEVIVPDIPTQRHWTRDLAVSADGDQLFVSIGSSSNVAAGMPEMTPEEILSFEETHGRGAAWGDEENRAVVRVFDPDGANIRNYATGLRNCSGMTVQPDTGALWCTGNERDHIGPTLAPDFLTIVQDGGFYGWPWHYTGGNEDPAHAGERHAVADDVTVPVVQIQAQSSTLQVAFYDADAVPAVYRGDAFATLHGSWNREERTGYKVIRALMEDGKPTGAYEDFMTGFVLDDDTVWGRPAGLAVAQDGALLVSDDANGTIFRVVHTSSR